MRYLIDTQLAVWAETDYARLPSRAAAILADEGHDLAFSVVATWEVVIKSARGRPDFTYDPAELRDALIEDGLTEVPVTAAHVLGVADLAPHHKDPFDRLMVAQARAERRRFLTSDRLLARYGDWVEVV